MSTSTCNIIYPSPEYGFGVGRDGMTGYWRYLGSGIGMKSSWVKEVFNGMVMVL
jgi:hypothetical protein